MDWVVDVSVGPCATLSLHVGGMLVGTLLFQIGILVTMKFEQNAQICGIYGIDLGALTIGFFVV